VVNYINGIGIVSLLFDYIKARERLLTTGPRKIDRSFSVVTVYIISQNSYFCKLKEKIIL
jgi:hypothetical protein